MWAGRWAVGHLSGQAGTQTGRAVFIVKVNCHDKEVHLLVSLCASGREGQIKYIEETFRAAREKPVHPTKPDLQPVEVLPILPLLDR